MALGESMDMLEGTTERQIERYKRALEEGRLESHHYGSDEHVDTVGAVALDSSGHLAAASSTGGVFGKLAGRVGDSAIFGAGTYASVEAAVVGTGVGELFLESLASARDRSHDRGGRSPSSSVRACDRISRYSVGRAGGTARSGSERGGRCRL